MIDTAVIPIAGLATRMGPIGRSLPKAMFPLVTPDGAARPLIRFILDEALAAGVDRVAVVVSPWQTDLVRSYLAQADRAEGTDLAGLVHYVTQPHPEGFGAAVLRAKDLVAGRPFLLMLGDYVYTAAPPGSPCAKQVAEAFDQQRPAAMVGMQAIAPEELPRCGVARGEPLDGNLFRCTALIEKPDLETARRELVTPGLPQDRFLAHAGIYAFAPELFDCLDELAAADRADGEEVQLTDAQIMLLDRRPRDCYLLQIEGVAHDAGTPAGYADTFHAVRHDRPGN